MAGKIDVEKLISEVEARPTLWDMTQSDYSNRLKRKKCWEEVTNIFAGEDMSRDEKRKLGELLHKKWKNIRDRFARELQETKGKSGTGARKKNPYMYTQQLRFLKDTLTPRNTVSSLENENGEAPIHVEDLSEPRPSTSATPTPTLVTSAKSKSNHPQIGKKRLHPVEAKILSSLEKLDQRRANKDEGDEDDNRQFLLSLLPGLKSLRRPLNTQCRIELMQCFSKYESHDVREQQPVQPPHTYMFPIENQERQHPQPQRQAYILSHHPQQYPSSQFSEPNMSQHAQLYASQSSSHLQCSNPQQYPAERNLEPHESQILSPLATPSPSESLKTYVSLFSTEEDSN